MLCERKWLGDSWTVWSLLRTVVTSKQNRNLITIHRHDKYAIDLSAVRLKVEGCVSRAMPKSSQIYIGFVLIACSLVDGWPHANILVSEMF